jgi:hypothetical protein
MTRDSKTNRDGSVITQSFLAACLLTAAFLLPHAAPWPVLAGMALAGLIRWGWNRYGGRRSRTG